MEKEIKKYLGRVLKKLYVKECIKKEIVFELGANISERINEEEIEKILMDMGNPERLGEDLMENHAQCYEKMGFVNALLYSFRQKNFRVDSQKQILGLPMVSVATGFCPETGKIQKAKGFFAFGPIAQGVFALGGIAAGVIAFGGVGAGLMAFGGLALGLLALGGLALGLFLALGGLAGSGFLSMGGLALSMREAAGGLTKTPYPKDAENLTPEWMGSFFQPDNLAIVLSWGVGLIVAFILGFIIFILIARLLQLRNIDRIIQDAYPLF